MMTEREIRTFVEQATATGGKWSTIERIVARWMADQKDAGEAGIRRYLDAYDKLRGDERPLVSDETIAEAAAIEERDRLAGGPPWEVPGHPDNAQPGGWHHGQIH